MSLAPVVIIVALLAQAPRVPEYWGSLRPGPHAVGFSQRWVIDSTRRLPAAPPRGPRYRPVLMNLWYPASGASGPRMTYRDYFSGPMAGLVAGSALAEYASALTRYVGDLSVRELTGTELDSLAPPLRQRVEAVLGSNTAARRDAPMRAGRLPVVFYLQGARASYDENVALCEYLASRGYLVVGSAFPQEDHSSFATNASDESRPRDVRRLLLELTRLPNVAVGPVTVIGHSAGAQAMLLFAADPSAPVDAVLALDTTQDYALLTDRTWAYMTDRVIEYRASIRTPVVLVAGPRALFELGDSLTAARRWLVTTPEIRHNDFIMQGVLRRELARDLPDGDSVEAARTRRAYDALARYLGAWLDAFVADTGGTTGPAPPPLLAVEFVPPGAAVSMSGRSGPLSARALRHLFTTGTLGEFADAFLAARRAGHPAGSNDVLMMLLTGTVAGGGRERASSILGQLSARDSTVRRDVLALIADRKQLFERNSLPDLAEVWQGYLTALDPAAGGARPRP